MTAYGQASLSCAYGQIGVEIHGVNRRYLELNFSMPRGWGCFEMGLRKQIAQCIQRGSVTVTVNWVAEGEALKVVPNLALAEALKKGWEALATALHLERQVPVELLLREKELLQLHAQGEEKQILRETSFLQEVMQKALEAFLAMKQEEGALLTEDLERRLLLLRKQIALVETQAAGSAEKYRQKLFSRLQESALYQPEDEERLLRELVIYAERVDITEEIVRFKSHLEQFSQLLFQERAEEGKGKALDFLVQELMRESNTIASKAADARIGHAVVTIKTELEKMREQIQNIE